MNAGLFLATVESGAMEGVQDEQLAQMKMLMRALAFGMPVVTHYFPAGVLVYWVTSAGWTLGQVRKLFRENTIISKSAAFVPSVASTVMHSRRDLLSHSSSRSRHVLVGHGCSLDDSVRRGLRRVDICVCVCVCVWCGVDVDDRAYF